jgi:NAD(P)-dependent dehydrogenase (short-subunit alcohol dehydrogenase family)
MPTMSRLLHFLTQAWTPPANPTTSFAGKTVIITGANSGFGFEAALKLHQLHASLVVLGVRDIAKGKEARQEIEKRCKIDGEEGEERGRIKVWKCDMDDYTSILEFVEKANGLEKLDGVVLNAGIFGVSYKVGKYSWGEVLQINVLSTALLGILLLPKLKASRQEGEGLSVLEFVGSGDHELVSISEERRKEESLLGGFRKREEFNPRTQYQTSKLFVMYVMQTFASLAKGQDGKPEVLVLAVCSGGAASNLSCAYEGMVAGVFKWVFGSLFLRSSLITDPPMISLPPVVEFNSNLFQIHNPLLLVFYTWKPKIEVQPLLRILPPLSSNIPNSMVTGIG